MGGWKWVGGLYVGGWVDGMGGWKRVGGWDVRTEEALVEGQALLGVFHPEHGLGEGEGGSGLGSGGGEGRGGGVPGDHLDPVAFLVLGRRVGGWMVGWVGRERLGRRGTPIAF